MPEGDVVWRTARTLHQHLAGELLLGSDLRVPSLALTDLSGRHTVSVRPRGKHLLHRVEGGLTLHSHLRMDGSWRVLTGGPAHPATRHHTVRAVLWTQTLVAVGDQLGMLDLVRTAEEHRVVGHLGPDLLDREFDRDLALANLLAHPQVPVAQALLDQRNLAGIGTIFASEPLFEHRVNPWTPIGAVGPEVLGAVVDTARRWMVRSARLGPQPGAGPTRLGAGPTRLGAGPTPPDGWLPWKCRVFGQRGRPCPRCQGTITAGTVGAAPRQRQVSYCPTCQPGTNG